MAAYAATSARRARLAAALRVACAVGAAGGVTCVALPLGNLAPALGAPVIALGLGMALAAISPPRAMRDELGLTSRYVLQAAMVLLGATISLRQVATVGSSSLPVMLGSLLSALAAAAIVGRWLGVPERLRAMIGVGTAICGASAIAAVSGVLGARASEVRYAISTIFVFNLAAVLLLPPIGDLLGMSQEAFGLWSGTAVNDASSAVAAAFAYGDEAAAHALVVKLTRTTMIVPIALALTALAVHRRREDVPGNLDPAATGDTLRRAMPWFVLWFLAASTANSLGLLGHAAQTKIAHAGLVLTTLALAAVGLSSDLREMRRTGMRPLLLGACVWLTVVSVSLGTQMLTGAT